MTTTLSTSSRFLGVVSAVNEAVIAHEDDETTVNGAHLDVADAVQKLAVAVHEFGHIIVAAAGAEAKLIIRTVLSANDQAQAYRCSYFHGCQTHRGVNDVAQSLGLLRVANNAVAHIMNHIETIMEELDK